VGHVVPDHRTREGGCDDERQDQVALGGEDPAADDGGLAREDREKAVQRDDRGDDQIAHAQSDAPRPVEDSRPVGDRLSGVANPRVAAPGHTGEMRRLRSLPADAALGIATVVAAALSFAACTRPPRCWPARTSRSLPPPGSPSGRRCSSRPASCGASPSGELSLAT
jgi:hypothetical protein